MIAIRLIGGLGNQCFQYAVGRHLAEIHQTELKIDLTAYDEYKLHAYSLEPFRIRASVASPEDVAGLTEVKEKHLHFDADILRLPDGVYLRGYWPTELYFRDIDDVVRDELTVASPPTGRDKELADMMASQESVSVHIRRADYLPNTYAEQICETCDASYYDRCVSEVAKRFERPHFFVLSDDKEWMREHFKLPYALTFVDHNGPDRNYQDLRLMSLCKHNIIANSTFSWWGAWLNRNPEKVVFGPQKWFTDKARSSSKDVIPSSWVRI
ncbi:MAG: alpha-1,2-fucosyltransferase [Gemmatimonadaceae bacterium]|nr:alpha-1,2-fucosyltransferase [Gemmatimonadaceae bacterium]